MASLSHSKIAFSADKQFATEYVEETIDHIELLP